MAGNAVSVNGASHGRRIQNWGNIAVTSRSKEPSHHIKSADIQRVLEVAGRLFAASGYDGVGMRQIAKESGVIVSSIQYHFGSKASLYEEVLDNKYEAFYEMITHAVEAVHDPMQKLECIIGTLFDSLLHDRAFLMLMQRDIVDMIARKYRPGFMEAYSKYFSLVSTLLQATLDRPVNKNVTYTLISVILGYAGLAAALSEVDSNNQNTNNGNEERRRELLIVGKRICRI